MVKAVIGAYVDSSKRKAKETARAMPLVTATRIGIFVSILLIKDKPSGCGKKAY